MLGTKRDPTRTTILRNNFVADMQRRFRKISTAIEVLVVNEDVFGLAEPVFMQENQAWRFRTDPQKVEEYRKWLQEQVNAKVLTPVGGLADKPWTAPYITSAYKKGAIRAYTDLRAEELVMEPSIFKGGQEEFLRSAFGQPEAQQKIELLYTRAFNELKGITDVMSQQMSRILADGLAHGQSPYTIARELRLNVAGITKTRANVLARTEIIRAHAEGQLDSFERLGVEELELMAEWSTAGDELVCPECDSYSGSIMTVDEARGLIPLHPNCRCAWIPASGKEKKTTGLEQKIESFSATEKRGADLNKEWSATYKKESEGPFWDVKGEKKPQYYTIYDKDNKLVAGATTIQSGLTTEILSIASHAKDQGKVLLDTIKSKNVFLRAMASSEKSKKWFVSQGFTEVMDKPGWYNVKWKKKTIK